MQALHGLVIAWSRFLGKRRCRTALGVGKVLCAQAVGGRPKTARIKTLLLCLIEDRFCMIVAEAISSPLSNGRYTVRQRSEKLRMLSELPARSSYLRICNSNQRYKTYERRTVPCCKCFLHLYLETSLQEAMG
jgi:hypothetical protein